MCLLFVLRDMKCKMHNTHWQRHHQKWIYHHHHHRHHHFLLSLREHTASTKHRHLILFLAILLTSPQLIPFSNASLWTDLLHVCLGLPLLFYPCGFQSKASLSMASFPFLNVCPIQFHFRLLTCMDISVSSVLLQSSSFEINSGQWILKIFLKQRLTNVCSFEIVVFTTFHVSYPYNSSDLTLLRKMRSLVLVDILMFLHAVVQKHHLLFEFVAKHAAQLLHLW